MRVLAVWSFPDQHPGFAEVNAPGPPGFGNPDHGPPGCPVRMDGHTPGAQPAGNRTGLFHGAGRCSGCELTGLFASQRSASLASRNRSAGGSPGQQRLHNP